MRIGVISDTHGLVEQAIAAIPGMGNIDMLIHLGDYIEDGTILRKKLKINVVSVKGNCDIHSEGQEEVTLSLGFCKIFAVHGHQYGVKNDLTRLYYRSLELDCNIALFGHTHVPLNLIKDKIFFMNPGSLGQPRGSSKPSYGILEIKDKNVHGEIFYL